MTATRDAYDDVLVVAHAPQASRASHGRRARMTRGTRVGVGVGAEAESRAAARAM